MAEIMDERSMLCLAGLSYRGFNDGTVGRLHTDAVARAIRHGLETLRPLHGAWELVWGPAVYRAPLSVLDDGLMYVVRHREARGHYAVAIRGTNPISAFDWVFGDLWTGHQVRWQYGGDANVRVSLSSALGLALLKGLRSDGPRHDATLWQAIEARLRDVLGGDGRAEGFFHGVAGWFAGIGSSAIAPLRMELAELLVRLARRRATESADDAGAHLEALVEFWESKTRTLILELVSRAAGLLGDRVDLALLALLEDEARLRASLGPGIDLLTFLAAAVEAASEPVHVIVTGHSKGAALASTLALALAETQGKEAAAFERWDPAGRATVHCYSYAGPTAGNAEFAAHSNRKIGKRCHRIANPMDVVPHAWALTDLQKLPTLYDAEVVAPLPALENLVGTIVALTQKLDYCHIGDLVTELDGKINGTKPLFFHQLVYQHMQAYLELLGLTDEGVDTLTLFDPLSVLPR